MNLNLTNPNLIYLKKTYKEEQGNGLKNSWIDFRSNVLFYIHNLSFEKYKKNI